MFVNMHALGHRSSAGTRQCKPYIGDIMIHEDNYDSAHIIA